MSSQFNFLIFKVIFLSFEKFLFQAKINLLFKKNIKKIFAGSKKKILKTNSNKANLKTLLKVKSLKKLCQL